MENEESKICGVCDKKGKQLTDIAGELICYECLSDDYFYCDNCQKYHYNNEDYATLACIWP